VGSAQGKTTQESEAGKQKPADDDFQVIEDRAGQ
jgi:hypothetical protein